MTRAQMAITTSQGNKFILLTQKPIHGCKSWEAETIGGKHICGGVFDAPQTKEEKKAFVDEVKDCIDTTISWEQ